MVRARAHSLNLEPKEATIRKILAGILLALPLAACNPATITRYCDATFCKRPPSTIVQSPGCKAHRDGPDYCITEDSPGWDCHTMGNRICGKPR